MPDYLIGGIMVNFPFEPYDVQLAYMEKVITSLSEGSNAVLESPTGTGKTLSLLCSCLAWIMSRKTELQAQLSKSSGTSVTAMQQQAIPDFNGVHNKWAVPKIIYASRTHSQLTQAMQELKRTAYAFMRAVVLGSRDQLCIHPEVTREQGNANKITMCKLRVQTRSCSFQTRVEQYKDHADFRGPTIMDIEDLVRVGRKLKMCPYYGSKELVADADITFMPYNYLLDPKARKANKVELNNTIVILDEAHNIEKICEESASVQIRSSDVAVAIDDVTHIMKALTSGGAETQDFGAASGDEPKDFNLEDLALLKEMLLDLERAIDGIVVENKVDGTTYPAAFIFELLAKANFNPSTAGTVVNLLERLVQYLAVASQNSMLRKGRNFEVIADLLSIVFINKEENMPKVYKSFKVHVQLEESRQQQHQTDNANAGGWLTKASAQTTTAASTKAGKIINYWCFNPGFGMEQLLNKNVRSIILTSGTLAPLKPLIAELAIPVAHHLENPHIVGKAQVYVKLIGTGPDREQLISNYANRDNPKYISSLGQTILNVARIVPDGLLVFFPSYPVLNQCVNAWQASGLWADISRHKPIYVEPRNKDDFNIAMESFYQSIKESYGACFMAVCRGKVSEGLDFADRNGRAVIITGLPYPPLRDPKVVLKRQYLDNNRTKENELLSGQDWYGLEATRAVNQAIGRVIRHRNDYGAILLCDVRFQQMSQVRQLSKWIRGHLGTTPRSSPFGPVVRELREFFKNAEKTVAKPIERCVDKLKQEECEEPGIVRSPLFADPKGMVESKFKFQEANKMALKVEKANAIEDWTPADYKSAAGRASTNHTPSALDFMSRLNSNATSIDFNSSTNWDGKFASCSSNTTASGSLVSIHKRVRSPPPAAGSTVRLQKRYKLIANTSTLVSSSSSPLETSGCNNVAQLKQAPEDRTEFLKELRIVLSQPDFTAFTAALVSYKREEDFVALMQLLLQWLGSPELHYLLRGMRRFLRAEHKPLFDERIASLTT